ncbi:hypothetical protein ACVINW_006043 [Bradyrhizobium sp. USDA 4461]
MHEREFDVLCAMFDGLVVASAGLLAFGTSLLLST